MNENKTFGSRILKNYGLKKLLLYRIYLSFTLLTFNWANVKTNPTLLLMSFIFIRWCIDLALLEGQFHIFILAIFEFDKISE